MSVSIANTTVNVSGKTVVLAERDHTVTGSWTFDRDPSAPFTVTSGSAVVTNLDADKLDGLEGAAYATRTGAETLTNKTITAPIIATISNTGVLTLPTSTDTLVGKATTDILSNKTLAAPVITGTTDLSGGQIKFPAAQSASADVNTLDDYEEGSWTPIIVSSGGGTPTYSLQTGKYIKIGKLIFFSCAVTLATKGTLAAGTVTIAGLPFASENIANQSAAIPFINFTMGTAVVFLGGVILANASAINLEHLTIAATSLTLTTVADLSATSALVCSGTYCAGA